MQNSNPSLCDYSKFLILCYISSMPLLCYMAHSIYFCSKNLTLSNESLYIPPNFKLLNLIEEINYPDIPSCPVDLGWYFFLTKFWEDSIHTIGQQVVLLQWMRQEYPQGLAGQPGMHEQFHVGVQEQQEETASYPYPRRIHFHLKNIHINRLQVDNFLRERFINSFVRL